MVDGKNVGHADDSSRKLPHLEKSLSSVDVFPTIFAPVKSAFGIFISLKINCVVLHSDIDDVD